MDTSTPQTLLASFPRRRWSNTSGWSIQCSKLNGRVSSRGHEVPGTPIAYTKRLNYGVILGEDSNRPTMKNESTPEQSAAAKRPQPALPWLWLLIAGSVLVILIGIFRPPRRGHEAR